MIPKIIHYCWFGRNPLPELAVKCIDSWRRLFPDYEIKEWNEDNFDVDIITYTSQAYKAKKYAFVSDYARFWILYHYGGLYFDTDVEVIKPMDDILSKGPFLGCEKKPVKEGIPRVNPGLGIGAFAGCELFKEILDFYSGLFFFDPSGMYNQITVVEYTTKILCRYGLRNVEGIQEVAGINIYPWEYFSPKDYVTKKIIVTENTYSIHHYTETWKPVWERKLMRVWVPLTYKCPRLTDFLKSLRCKLFSFYNRMG